MSDQNLDGFNSKPTKAETSYVDPITPEADEASSELTEVETEVILGVDEADVAEADVTEVAVLDEDSSEAPLNPLMTNTTYTSPGNESSQPEVEESESEPDSSIEALPKEKVERKLTEPELRERIAKLTSEIDELVDVASKSDAEMESEGENLEERIRVQEEFTHWVAKRRSSYAWQLLNRLESHQKNLELDEKLIRDFSESAVSFPEGFGESLRKWFMKRFWMNFSISWIAILLLLLVNKFSAQLSSFLANLFGGRSFLKAGLNAFFQQVIGMTLGQVIGSIFGFSLLHFFGLLFAFSRKNSEHSQLVAEESGRALAMEKGIDEVRNARELIDSLHPQVPQILEVLSLSLHRPWVIKSDSLLFSGSVPDTATLPSCVEVAVPVISRKSLKYEELVLKTMNKIQTPAWRAEAHNAIIQRLAESIGFGSDGMAIRELDDDQRKSGKRQLILTAGQNLESAELIGEKLVEKFTRITQEDVLPDAQPDVISLRPNPLEGLELDGSIGSSSSVPISKWEEKLGEIADLASPWSISSFSEKGQALNRHNQVESIFIASSRVRSKEGVEKTVAVNPGARPFEVAIRVDLSVWCKPDEVAIFSDFKPTQEQVERWAKGGSTHGQNVHVDGIEEEGNDGSEHLVI
jgi:molecular chaperone GrpE (heat shock protein)